ncbi:ATP binding [Coemansia sp. IMI 209127]|nr:ATP binding [Coemansia sp. IMI 209127]
MQQVLQWNEEKVCQWVCEQGFNKYESVFRDNMITGEALVELDYTLLKELSVRTVGERVRLNLAIRRLRKQCLQVDADEPPSSSAFTGSSRPKRSATLEYSNIRESLAMHVAPSSTAMSGATATGELTSAADHASRKHRPKDPPKLPRVSLSSNSISMASAANISASSSTAGASVSAGSIGNGMAGTSNSKSPDSASSASSSSNNNNNNSSILQRANTDVRAFTTLEHKQPSHNAPIYGNITQRKTSHNTSTAKTVQPLQPLKSSTQQSASMFPSDAAAATSVPKNSKLSLKPIASHQHMMQQGIEPMSAPLPRLHMLTSSSQKQSKRSPPSVQPLQLLKDAAESRRVKATQNDEIERLGLQFQEFFGTDISVTRLADSLSVRTWNVTITGPENEMRQVSIANSSSAQAILNRVRREFDLRNDADGDQYSLFSMTSAAGGARCLSNEELENMFADPTRAPPEKFFLRKRHQLSRPPIGTKRSEHLQRAIEKLGNIIPVSSSSQQQQQQQQQNPHLQRPESKWDNTSERLTQILGERPPSELVSMNVEKYFPGNEARARHSIMRRRRQGSHDNDASLDGTDPVSARQSRRQSRAHRRSTSTSTSSVSASRILQAARLQSATISNSNRWSVLTSGLEPIKESSQQSPSFLNVATNGKRAALPDSSDPASNAKEGDAKDGAGKVQVDTKTPTTAVDSPADELDKVTPRKSKRMSRIYTSAAVVETMHSISSESLQLSDNGSNMSDRDDDSAGSLSDLSSSHLSDSFDSDDDSFYDSLYDSDIDADEDLAADDDSEMHANTSAVGSASVASAMYVQGSDQSTAVLNATSSSSGHRHAAAGAEPKEPGANDPGASEQSKSISRSASGTSRSGRTHSTGGNGGGSSSGSKKKVWIKGAPIASGSFGSVYFGMNTRTGAIMAVKEVELPTPGSVSNNRNQRMVDALKHELDLLKGLDHKNVVKYLGTDVDDTNLYIFLEYVSGGSVSSALASFGMFPESLVRTYTAQILEGLVYLHEQGIIHRDIKGGNVLIDQDGSVKISDFGISKRVDEAVAAGKTDRRASLQGSVFWMAPEVVKDTHYTFKGDVWSLGCLVIEMMTGTHPFPDLDQLQALYSIGQRGRPKTPDGISPDGNDFLELTLQVDVDMRPTATDLMAHVFVCDIAPPSP